jgi:hypothetical protein
MHVHTVWGRSSMKMNELQLNAIFLQREEWKYAESSCHTVHCRIDFQTFLTKTSLQLRHHFLFTYFKWALGDLYKFSVTMVRNIRASCRFWNLSVFCYSESRTRIQRKYKYVLHHYMTSTRWWSTEKSPSGIQTYMCVCVCMCVREAGFCVSLH